MPADHLRDRPGLLDRGADAITSQLARVRDFQERHREEAHEVLAALKDSARLGGNMFAVLMEAARVWTPSRPDSVAPHHARWRTPRHGR